MAESESRRHPSPKFVDQIQSLMTPEELLNETRFENPEIIVPEIYPDFDSLLAERDRIRTLRLLPIKDDENNAYYHSQPKEQLVNTIHGYTKEGPFALKDNSYPYLLSKDVGQQVLWIRDRQAPRRLIAESLVGYVQDTGLGIEDIILFERSKKAETSLVRGTVSEVRHVHVWTRRA